MAASVEGARPVVPGVEVHDAATLHRLRMQHNDKAHEQRNPMGYALNVNCHALVPRGRAVDDAAAVARYLQGIGFAKAAAPLEREDVALHVAPPAVPGGAPAWFVQRSVSGEPRFVHRTADGDVRTHASVSELLGSLGYDTAAPPPSAFDAWLEA